MSRLLTCLVLLLHAPLVLAQDPTISGLPRLAAESDLVALAQVADTDYQYTRSFPSGGSAFLRVLIPYKVTRAYGDLIEVYEEGLHEHECYFPGPQIGEEGRRYLVFLRFNPDRPAQYRGLAEGCALEVLVTDDNSYALRAPVDGIESAAMTTQWAQALTFADRHAVVDEEALSVETRDAWLDGGWLLRQEDGRLAFTHGIPIREVRALIGEENLTLDRSLLRPEAE